MYTENYSALLKKKLKTTKINGELYVSLEDSILLRCWFLQIDIYIQSNAHQIPAGFFLYRKIKSCSIWIWIWKIKRSGQFLKEWLENLLDLISGLVIKL